ncbi:exosortase E/protease, VPEID-CTERM system [Marimonas sp. MJW-29]|uniref:Exosortase E/protease, VPEID-CTERM system n=1 Tax=Sulfitobacter sediminis TaxID=3234186 RepID=A0ABV3RTC5_9RHOB
MSTLTDPHSNSSDRSLPLGLLAALMLLLVVELGAIGITYNHLIPFSCKANWPQFACLSASLMLVSLYCVVGALVLIAMLRPALFKALLAEARLGGWPLATNVSGVGLAFAPLAFLVEGEARNMLLPSFAFWTVGMAFLLGGLALCLAPIPAWRSFLTKTGGVLIVALVAGIATPWIAIKFRVLWGGLDGIASITFSVVTWIIDTLGYEVQANAEEKWIGANDFFIAIGTPCSGVEGFALVTLFVTLYLWLFRADLRFPRAFLLYPLGLAASAIFNALRIALLLVIGLEGNPELAAGGFHSHAGWLMFTFVALGIITLAQTVPALKRATSHTASVPVRANPVPFWQDPVVACILPFAVFMFGALLASTFATSPGLVYPLRALAVAAVMMPFWGLYRALGWRINGPAVGVGAVIAIYWVLIPVAPAETAPYGTLSGGLLILWFIVRGIGTTFLVPVFEELFFRDYLEGLFRARLGSAIGAGLMSAALFALLHDRWAEAFIAGLMFSWLTARPGGRITDAILAHMVANGLIFAAALATGRLEII